MAGDNDFLSATSERADLNQYWYSKATIHTFVEEACASAGKAALVSTPSIYFSLPEDVRQRSKVLDYDRQWAGDPGFVFYDFNEPEAVLDEFRNSFDFVLVDPPFITLEVWTKYAITTRLLLRPGGRVLCTTIAENADMMKDLLDLQPVRFRPSIPNLVYQYCVYTNYTSDRLDVLNPEIDDEDWRQQVANQRHHAAGYNSDISLKPCVSEAAPIFLDGQETTVSAVDDVPLSPAVAILTELRTQLNSMKRCTEAMNAPVQTAVRRRRVGGDPASAASAKAEEALAAADAAASGLAKWLEEHAAQVATALEEVPEAFTRSLEQDRFRTSAVAAAVNRAKNDGLQTMEEYNNFALTNKQHSAAVFRLSNLVMDRIKLLKREIAAAVASAGTGGREAQA